MTHLVLGSQSHRLTFHKQCASLGDMKDEFAPEIGLHVVGLYFTSRDTSGRVARETTVECTLLPFNISNLNMAYGIVSMSPR